MPIRPRCRVRLGRRTSPFGKSDNTLPLPGPRPEDAPNVLRSDVRGGPSRNDHETHRKAHRRLQRWIARFKAALDYADASESGGSQGTALYDAANVLLARITRFSKLKRWGMDVAKRR